MAITLQQLLDLQKQILKTLWFPALDLFDPVLQWASQNVVGCAVLDQTSELAIMVRNNILPGFEASLAVTFADFTFRYWVTGGFELTAGLGIQGDIFLKGRGGGKIGLFLIDPKSSRRFALTCAHVLNAVPSETNPPEVDGRDGKIGSLKHIIKLSSLGLLHPDAPNPVEPNSVDCALAEITVPASNILPDGQPIRKVVAAAQEKAAIVTVGGKGKVLTTHADIKLSDDVTHNDFYFSGLTLATGPGAGPPVDHGDSGSLAVDGSLQPVGIAIGRSKHTITTDNPPTDFGAAAAICDLGKILTELSKQTGPLEIL